MFFRVETNSFILCPSIGPKYLKPKSSNIVVGKKKFFALDSTFFNKASINLRCFGSLEINLPILPLT